MATATPVSTTSHVCAFEMAIKNAMALLDAFHTEGIAIEGAHITPSGRYKVWLVLQCRSRAASSNALRKDRAELRIAIADLSTRLICVSLGALQLMPNRRLYALTRGVLNAEISIQGSEH